MSNSARARAFANKEKQAHAARVSYVGRALLLSLATVLSFATISLLAADQLYRPDTFVIDQLKIKGKLRHMQPQEIEQLVQEIGIGNFFSIELDQIKAKVESLAWVQNAEVRREWPHSLLIEVREHRPVMRWNQDKWLNSFGQVVDLPGVVSVPNAIALRGQDQDAVLMLRQAYSWKKRLAADGLDLRSIELSGSHAWTLGLQQASNGADFELLLGREQTEQRLSRFVYLFETHFQQSDQRLQRVDARYPDGLAIKSETIENNQAVAMQGDRLTAGN